MDYDKIDKLPNVLKDFVLNNVSKTDETKSELYIKIDLEEYNKKKKDGEIRNKPYLERGRYDKTKKFEEALEDNEKYFEEAKKIKELIKKESEDTTVYSEKLILELRAKLEKRKKRLELELKRAITISEEDKAIAKQVNDDKKIQYKYPESRHNYKKKWDFKIDDPIPFFDNTMTYELTGYRPINERDGLDFNPEWFTEARRTFERTGKYTEAPLGTKSYDDYWLLEYDRMNNGMESHGYRITGDNYFFLNYYRMMRADEVDYAGKGRAEGFADFYAALYEYFHYVELCKKLKKNCVGLKGRGLGWSEIGADICVNTFERSPLTRCIITANTDVYLELTLKKCWNLLNWCNDNTLMGLFKPLITKTPKFMKTAVEELGTRNLKGWLSEIQGIIADSSDKVRGDRTDVLMFEEFGSNPVSKQSFVKGKALVTVNGIQVGIMMGWGTGGDKNGLSGLSDIFYHPNVYNVLPMRHTYTKTGEVAITAFFIPSYRIVLQDENGKRLMDKRGYTPEKEGREYYLRLRNVHTDDPEAYIIYCAEYCFIPEEALILEGDNQFNKVLLVDQLTQIKLFNRGPHVELGLLEYNFEGKEHTDENAVKFLFIPSDRGKVRIIEHPIKDASGFVPQNLYVAGIDGIDLGLNDTSSATDDPSDFCIVIKKRVMGLSSPMYVAIYKDRPKKIDDAYRIALRLCLYYNCKVNVEASKVGVIKYFLNKKMLKHLMLRPRITFTNISKTNVNQIGTPTTASIISHLLELISNYIEEYSTDMWFEEMINEAIHYSYLNKRKFDIIAAMGMCELADEELSGVKPKEHTDSKKWEDVGYYTDPLTGYRRFGIIPGSQDRIMATLYPLQTMGVKRTSDTREITLNSPQI